MTPIRVLIVEDSITVRKRLQEVLESDPELTVVGEAADGKEAIDLCLRLRPDVVTLDMVLPSLSGLAVTEYLMAYRPTPIVIVSASFNRGELFKTYDALAAGAVDVLEKPTGDAYDGGWERRFIATVKLVSRIKVITHPRAKLGHLGETVRGARCAVRGEDGVSSPAERQADALTAHRAPRTAHGSEATFRLLVMGASTGGPAAVVEILKGLPPNFPLPILLVLHIGEPFGLAFADWLDAHSPLPVRYARDREPLPSRGEPKVLLAPPDRHLVIRGEQLRLTSDPERHSCRPSVDWLFETAAVDVGEQTIACLLTGMGRDGAQGLLAVQRAGGTTLAQDEATSVVFGMPREAILLGAADHILPLSEFAPTLLVLAGLRPSMRRPP